MLAPSPGPVGDPRFFDRSGPFTVANILRVLGEAVTVSGDTERVLRGVAPLQTAGPAEISFLDNRRYAGLLAETRAGAVIVHGDYAARVPAGCVAFVTAEPYLAWARAASLFHPRRPARPGIHPSAVIDASATVDASAEIGPLCVVGARATVGANTVLAPGVIVGEGVGIGTDCRIGAQSTISHAIVGDRVTLFPGVRIGQEGFGFAPAPGGFLTVPQLGRVIVGDDVKIGANTTIDRGSTQDTEIGAGSRLDNLVQIGHNVRLGRCCVVVAQVGIAGSVTLGDFVQIAGQAGIAGHLTVGAGARVGAQAGVMGDVPEKADWVGSPAQPARSAFREVAALRRLAAKGRDRAAPGAAAVAGDPAEATQEMGSGRR